METRPAGQIEKWGKNPVCNGETRDETTGTERTVNHSRGISGYKIPVEKLETLNKSELVKLVLDLVKNLNTAILKTLHSIIDETEGSG